MVDEAIARHGGERYADSKISFRFRDAVFRLEHDGGRYRYERVRLDSLGEVRDVLTTNDIDRMVDGMPISLTERDSLAISSQVNSVSYFALLPFRLNDRSAQKRLLAPAMVGGRAYDKVEVTFEQEGGGRDWQDRFVYWFHGRDHTLDYMAYQFENNSRGSRFRVSTNPREVGGLRFADYENYVFDSLGFDIATYDLLWEQGGLELVSHVVLEEIRVNPGPTP